MRCDGEPVRLEMRTTRRMSRALQPDKQIGTLSVHTIRASGHVHRTNRPNTRLHPTTTPHHQINSCNAGAIHTGHSGRQRSARRVDQGAGPLNARAAASNPEIKALLVGNRAPVASKVPVWLNGSTQWAWGLRG